MIPCDLLWYPDESYADVLYRAIKLAKEHDQLVTIYDLVSKRPVGTVTPNTPLRGVRRWK